MLQLDLKTFFKNPFRDGLFFLPTFFLSFHAPSEFMSLFFTAQRAKTGTLSYPSTEINLPFKNKGSQMER